MKALFSCWLARRAAGSSGARSVRIAPLLGAGLIVTAVGLAACSQGPQPVPPAATTTTVVAPAEPTVAAAAPAVPRLVLPVVTAPKPAPVYPIDMLRARQHGFVYVECVIDEAGHVVTTRVRDSSNAAFNAATEEAVRHWTFTPGTRDGVPITMRVLVPVEYNDKEVTTLP